MDGQRFDSLVRSLASSTNRRTLVKGLLGLGAVATVHSPTEAARRSTPTPKPVRCTSPKELDGDQCVCPAGTTTCGPDCCPAGAQCCDNACCYGECYGEELCCPTGNMVCDGECGPWECCTDNDCQFGACTQDRICVCEPVCLDGTCGLDGCGGTCGCGDGQECVEGLCFFGCNPLGFPDPIDCPDECSCHSPSGGSGLCVSGTIEQNDFCFMTDYLCPPGSLCDGLQTCQIPCGSILD